MNSMMAVALHAAPDDAAVEQAEGGEQGGDAVPLVIVGHRLAAPRLDRQSGLGAVERLDLALLVDRQHHRMGRRIDIEPDDVGQLGGKLGVARALEGAQSVRLQFVRPPDALHRAQRDAHRLGHRPAGPMGRLGRRCAAGQRHHPRRDFRRQRRLAGLAGLVAQQPFHASLGKALLPAPHRRPTDPDALGHSLRRMPIPRGEHNARPLNVLAQPAAVVRNRHQPIAFRGVHYHTDRLRHGPILQPWRLSHIVSHMRLL